MKRIPSATFLITFFFAVTSAHADFFGVRGRDGERGAPGMSGQDGQSLQVVANGTQQYFDLSGRDGSPGLFGRDGEDAWSCHQPYGVNSDLWGAPGGDGGDGGWGGSGGRGGDLTVYFDKTEKLKAITVRGTPGRGSYGGNPGRGGRGCPCTFYSWRVRRCENVRRPDGRFGQHCYETTHFCHPGSDGRHGFTGRNGSNGTYGNVTLIPQIEPLLPDVDSVRVHVAEMDHGLNLAINQWQTRQGALQFFGNGSDLSDSYTFFTGRRMFPVEFSWSATREQKEFSTETFNAFVIDSEAHLTQVSDVWFEAQRILRGNTTVFDIQKIIHANEATQLSVSVRGNGKNTELVISDAAHVSQIVRSGVELKLEADTLFDKNLFVGNVPGNLLQATADELIVKVGKMGIKDKYLAPGKGLKASLSVIRALGNREATWTNSWQGKLD